MRTLDQRIVEHYTFTGGGEQAEVAWGGDLGYFWSSYRATGTSKTGGEPMQDRGHSMFTVIRQPDGSWETARLTTHRDPDPTARQAAGSVAVLRPE